MICNHLCQFSIHYLGRSKHIDDLRRYNIAYFDQHIAARAKIFNYTCSVADRTATMMGPIKMPNGKIIQPTHKTTKLEFCTVATWKGKEITEERFFYDVTGMMKQLCVST